MYKTSLTASLLGLASLGFCQSTSTLRSQIEFCKQESEKLEFNLDKYKNLLELQGIQINELKLQIQSQETEIKQLTYENNQLKNAALNLLDMAVGFEQKGKLEEAIEVYKLLIRSYPGSIESISSRLKLKTIREDLSK